MSELKYLTIKNHLKEAIERNDFKPGEKIYSELELKEKYGVSNTTVVRALQELVFEGYLTRIQGKGTFVSKGMLKKKVGFTEHNVIHKPGGGFEEYTESVKVLSIKEITDKEIARIVEIGANEKIIHFTRMRLDDQKPFAIQHNYIPKKYLPGIDLSKPERYESISKELKENHGINIFNEHMKERIKVVYPLNDELKKLFQVETDFPVFVFERVTYFSNGLPLEFVKTYTHHKYYSIEIES